jgi:septal ring factor EnvC (AmiA/AmiB activator)
MSPYFHTSSYSGNRIGSSAHGAGPWRAAPASLCALLGFCVAALAAQGAGDRARVESQAKRASDRLVVLQREADQLASQQRSLLVDLRRLEVERDLKTEQLRKIQSEGQKVALQLGIIGNEIDELEQETAASGPILEARLKELYKLGSAGYVRLLFNATDLRELGRTYRMVAAVASLDRIRAEQHKQNLVKLRAAHRSLEKQRSEMTRLQNAAAAARSAADRAAQSRAQLIAQIDARRDLMAALAEELQAAHEKLQQILGAINSGAPRPAVDGSALPIRPFRGDLDWPVAGKMLTTFGRRGTGVAGAPAQNGVQMTAQEGSPVRAVHDGTVIFSGPFTGYGTLVIVDHGSQVYSLYGQLATADVERGVKIGRGDAIGTAGRVLVGIPGMYFEMRVDGKPVDPLEWLKQKS